MIGESDCPCFVSVVRDGFSEEETLLLREIGKALLRFVSHCFGILPQLSASVALFVHTQIYSAVIL